MSYSNYSTGYSNQNIPTAYFNPDENHEENIDSQSVASFEEPPWQDKVGERGDLFYIQANDPVEYVTAPMRRHPYNGSVMQDIQNGDDSYDSSDPPVTSKATKGIKKKVKGLLGSSTSSGKANSKLTNSELSRHNINTATHGVTFNDVPTGVMKEVTLFVDPFIHNYGRRATPVENLFGIIPGYFGSPSLDSGDRAKDKRIMVQGLIPGAESMKAGVKIGEWLMCVNDLEVNFDNIDSILSGITGPRYIKLTLQKIAIQTSPKQVLVKKKNVINQDLVRVVSGERLNLPHVTLAGVPHSLLFLSLDGSSESMQGKEDVLYQFPATDQKFVEIRGLFSTLCQMLLDVTNNTAKNTSLTINEKLVHTGYFKENRELLVLSLPADRLIHWLAVDKVYLPVPCLSASSRWVSLCHLNKLLDDVVRLIKVLFGSLHSGFQNSKNHSQLNHFFSLLFQKVLLREQMFQNGHKHMELMLEPFYQLLPAVRGITLPEETKIMVSNCLSELEASDFADMSEDYYDLRRMYTITGSCLFYKGYLLCSHLHKEDLLDSHLYLQHYCLLTLCSEEQLGQVILWREIFPTRHCHRQVDPVLPGYTEPQARWFILIVGMKNLLLGVVLEAGGCASWPDGNPGPDPFYVDQVKATIQQLESLDVINQCEARLKSPSVPSLASIDWFIPAKKSQSKTPMKDSTSDRNGMPLNNAQSSTRKQQPPITTAMKKGSQKEPESILKKSSGAFVSQPDGRFRGRGAVYDMDSDADSHSTNSDGSTPFINKFWSSHMSEESMGSGSGSSGLFKGSKRRRNMLSAYDMSNMKQSMEGQDGTGSYVKLTTGCDNTLFQYIHMDSIDGMLVCPCQQELAALHGVMNKQLLQNFQQACMAIRSVLHKSHSKQEWIRNGSLGKFGPDDSLGVISEHGVLFECQSTLWTDKKAPPTRAYWVIGRQFEHPYPREFYVCFLDNAQQNAVEMAFKLGFGLNL